MVLDIFIILTGIIALFGLVVYLDGFFSILPSMAQCVVGIIAMIPFFVLMCVRF